MPEKVHVTEESFAAFERTILKRGFRRVSRKTVAKDIERLELIPPSPRVGREVGFVYYCNGLTVVVWTSYVEEEGKSRDNDCGWVLIREGDDVKYFTRPLHRTKHFLHRLLWYAAIAQVKIEQRPLCPVCKGRMDIVHGKGLKSCYWLCYRPDKHRKSQRRSWDYGLPEEAVKFLRAERRKRASYQKKLASEQKKFGAALQSRIGWTVGRPDNMQRV